MKTKIMFSIMAFLLLAMPFVTAQTVANETTQTQAKEYTWLEMALDRIKLAFTFQIERKVALMNQIQQRREQHYEFLLSEGKTKQAEKFNNQTIGLVKNFDAWKANKQGIISNFEQKVVNKTGQETAKIPETAAEKGKTETASKAQGKP